MAAIINRDRTVGQLHWGGGTPNYLSLRQVETLWNTLNDYFRFDADAEISIEVNPRSLDQEYLFFLKDLGFNRIGFGIQDFNPQVQQAVNRIQRRIPQEALPLASEKLDILQMSIEELSSNGYVFIGMDHFAKYLIIILALVVFAAFLKLYEIGKEIRTS